MNPLLAISREDGFALAMLVMLTLALGSVLMILIRIARNSGKHDEDVDELMKPPKDEPVAPSGGKGKTPSEPWERDADWWKKRSG
ncbi:MAG: hypothetical protein ACPG4K_05285 [Haloferula sp.]